MFDRFKSKKGIVSDEDSPKRKVCANCKNPYIESDRYCRFCGAPMGAPDYIEESFECIYGPPPVKRKHECKKCGYQWTTYNMIDDENFCPKCGNPVLVFENT